MPRRSNTEIAQLIDDLDASGLSVAQFATQMGVTDATVYNWKRKVKHLPPFPKPVHVIPQPAQRSQSGIVLQLPGQIRCHLDSDFDPHTFQRMLASLQSFSSSPC